MHKYEIDLRTHSFFGLQKDSKNKFTHTNSTMKECIEGTVPILEISPEVVESYGSVTQFLNRRPIDRVHTDTVRKDGRDHELSEIGRFELRGVTLCPFCDVVVMVFCFLGSVHASPIQLSWIGQFEVRGVTLCPFCDVVVTVFCYLGSVHGPPIQLSSLGRFEVRRVTLRRFCDVVVMWAVVTMRADEIHEAKAKFNVYKFLVEQPDYSSVQIYFLHEISEGRTSKELMQTGFVVDPKRFGDRLIFYIFYRLHDRVDGCFNLECGGFIQDDRKYYPGMPMEHLSVYNGPQRDSLLSIRRTTTSNSNIVWAVYLQDTKVGHWPAIYFKDLIFAANRVDFGGEIAVSNNSPGTPFSKTDMGTGGFPKDGFGKATFVRNIELKTTKDVPILDMEKSYVATKSKCYGVKGSTSNDWGDYIYYGGPGGDNPKCKH
ncbi:hypothetical protein SUGI_0498200 [Cryptomeria japonica]|nr:hypothetical protein SUGI_0498200 [Cryptomeria japonica]